MTMKEKARERAANGLISGEELPGNFTFNTSPETTDRQRNFVARRYGFAPHVASIIATLAFTTREAAR
jgi:hypothetical protein